ncbi:MAG: FadR/GntR family transcriptional regulator [Spirochaetota bacterium]
MPSISDQIYNDIETRIISGDLKPGDKLPTENELCNLWNTSRISVRQALERFVAIGILAKIRGGGSYVQKPDPSLFLSPLLPFVIFREESLLNILEFRVNFEVGNVRLCTEKCDETNLAKLRDCLARMEANQTEQNKRINMEYVEADLDFHMEIARASKNPVNVKINEMLRHVMRKHQMNLNALLGTSTSIKEHRNIFIAIVDRDPELAAHFMAKHINRTINEIRRLAQVDS